MHLENLIDKIKYPLFTNKAITLLGLKQYTFMVASNTTKTEVKYAIEYLFKVRVISINTCNMPCKRRYFGKLVGDKAHYKKAIVRIAPEDFIICF